MYRIGIGTQSTVVLSGVPHSVYITYPAIAQARSGYETKKKKKKTVNHMIARDQSTCNREAKSEMHKEEK